MYQGWGRSNYFEGWYFKMVTKNEDRALAVIPGIVNNKKDPHAFIQVSDGTQCKFSYHRFDLQDFKPNSKRFKVEIGGNQFSLHKLFLDLPDIKGQVLTQNPTPYPGTKMHPGIMGPYSFVPFMQCNHGLVSMHHHLQGGIQLDGESIDFGEGKGYMEKDWGKSFPKSWIWTQCNHFQDDTYSVMASVAHIPWIKSSFIGFLALVWDGHTLKLFTTYTGARMKARILGREVHLSFKDAQSQLNICASMADGVDLVFSHPGRYDR